MRTVVVLLMVALCCGCAPTPKPLSPEAVLAFQATRVVKVLDVVRDAAIAANELSPPAVSTDSTRQVVIWHKTAIRTIEAAPGGWQATVKAGIYALTCDARAGSGSCTSPMKPEEVQRLSPYIGLALIVIAEVQ